MALRPGLALASATSPATDGTVAAVGTSSLAARQDHGHALGPLVANLNYNNNAHDNLRRGGYQDVGIDLAVVGAFVRFGDTMTWRQTAANRNVGLDVTRKLIAGPAATSSTTAVTLASYATSAGLAAGATELINASFVKTGTTSTAQITLVVGGVSLNGISFASTDVRGAFLFRLVRASASLFATSHIGGIGSTLSGNILTGAIELSSVTVAIQGLVVNAADSIGIDGASAVEVT